MEAIVSPDSYDKNGREPELAKKWATLGFTLGISVAELITMVQK